MALFRRGPFRARDGGQVEILLDDDERRVLADVVHGFRELLLRPEDPALRRLFPTAHPNDPEAEAEWRSLMGDQLLESRFAAFDVVERTIRDEAMGTEDLAAWMQACNAMRLVLGTRLDVSEDDVEVDPDDPNLGAYALYDLLAWLVDGAVRVLSADLPPGGRS